MKKLSFMIVIAFVLSLTVYSCAKTMTAVAAQVQLSQSKAACKCKMILPN